MGQVSSWYYLRYIDPHNTEKLADEDLLKQWLPVDIYVGGAEHGCTSLALRSLLAQNSSMTSVSFQLRNHSKKLFNQGDDFGNKLP